MGTVIRDHPALGSFLHDGWCDFCFIPLLHGSRPLDLSVFGVGRIEPIIRSIGHMLSMDDKAYLFEARVGRGRLLAASLCLDTVYDFSPAARYFLGALVRYISKPKRDCRNRISPARLRRVLR